MDQLTKLLEVFTSETFRTVATAVGALYLLRIILCVVWCLVPFVTAYFIAPLGIFRTNLKKYGSWAVVTGASEGIGKGYAVELAKRGLNVVIMSRSEEKLQKVADEIKGKYSVEVKIIAVDFSSGQEIYPQLSQELKDLDIGVLVNNVGFSYEFPQYLHLVPPERLHNVIEINCQSMIQMTHLVLPKMVERKRGVVINIGSTAANTPMAMLTVYSASKVFVSYFSDALRQEYASRGIVIQNIRPGVVATAMSGVRRTSFMIPSPSTFARTALNTVGHLSDTAGCVPHSLQILLINLTPRFITDRVIMREMKTTRDKALRRKARQKKD